MKANETLPFENQESATRDYAGSDEGPATGASVAAAFFSALFKNPVLGVRLRERGVIDEKQSLPLSFCLFAFSRWLSITRSLESSASTSAASVEHSSECCKSKIKTIWLTCGIPLLHILKNFYSFLIKALLP